MVMKAYACPRCLTLSSTTEDGDGGVHTCTPTPLVRSLESQIEELKTKLEAEDRLNQIIAGQRDDLKKALKAYETQA